jgi:hypothetical protein
MEDLLSSCYLVNVIIGGVSDGGYGYRFGESNIAELRADDRSIISSDWTLISTILDIQLPTGASIFQRIGRLESTTLRKVVRSLVC